MSRPQITVVFADGPIRASVCSTAQTHHKNSLPSVVQTMRTSKQSGISILNGRRWERIYFKLEMFVTDVAESRHKMTPDVEERRKRR